MKKKKSFFLLMAVLLLGVIPVTADDLFFYKTDGKLTIPLENLRKLTISGSDLVVVKTNDAPPTTINLDNLYCFSFLDNLRSYTSIAPAPSTTDAVNVWFKDGSITVKSVQTVIAINVFDLQGRKVVQLHPQSQEINIPSVSYSSGVYLVQVVGENSITTKKIIKN